MLCSKNSWRPPKRALWVKFRMPCTAWAAPTAEACNPHKEFSFDPPRMLAFRSVLTGWTIMKRIAIFTALTALFTGGTTDLCRAGNGSTLAVVPVATDRSAEQAALEVGYIARTGFDRSPTTTSSTGNVLQSQNQANEPPMRRRDSSSKKAERRTTRWISPVRSHPLLRPSLPSKKRVQWRVQSPWWKPIC